MIDGITTVGDMAIFTWQMLRWLVTRLPCRGTVLLMAWVVVTLGLLRGTLARRTGKGARNGWRSV